MINQVITEERVKKALARKNHYPDYDLIFQLSNTYVSPLTLKHARLTRVQELQEYCTINMGSHRQNGKTDWAIQKVIEGSAVIIARDRVLRDETLRKVTLEFAKTEHGAAVTREKGKINIVIDEKDPNPSQTVDFILAQFKLASQRNVYTSRDLVGIADMEHGVETHFSHVKLVIIDDASNNSRLSEIYRWLADNIHHDITIVKLG